MKRVAEHCKEEQVFVFSHKQRKLRAHKNLCSISVCNGKCRAVRRAGLSIRQHYVTRHLLTSD